MSQSIEWAGAHEHFTLIDGDEEAPDGNTPNEGNDWGYIALVTGGVALIGNPAELLELLSDGIAKVSAHLAGQN